MKEKTSLHAQLAVSLPNLQKLKCELARKYQGIPLTGSKLTPTALTRAHTENLIGIGIAEKKVRGRKSGQVGITFFVEKKIAETSLEKKLRLPRRYRGFPCDVVACGPSHPARATLSPEGGGGADAILMSGSTISVNGNSFGTVGGFATDHRGGRYLLSNCHVLSPGDLDQPGKQVFQYLPDGSNWPIGWVTDVVPLYPNQSNLVDLAAAWIDPEIEISTANSWGRVPGYRPVSPLEGVRKFGAGTGPTYGASQVLDSTWRWGWTMSDGSYDQYYFTSLDGFSPTDFADHGDSGSMVYAASDNCGVSLIAGQTPNGIDCGIPIELIEAQLASWHYSWL